MSSSASWEAGLKPRQIKAEEWEVHREHIRGLYLGWGAYGGSKCQDVRKALYERFGFYATYIP